MIRIILLFGLSISQVQQCAKESQQYCQKIADLEERIIGLESENESQEQALRWVDVVFINRIYTLVQFGGKLQFGGF